MGGSLLRIVDIVVLKLSRQDKSDFLVETVEKLENKRQNRLDRLPAIKRRPDENQFVAMRKLLKRLRIDENFVFLDNMKVSVYEEGKESPSYPGIATLYRKRVISGELSRPSDGGNSENRCFSG